MEPLRIRWLGRTAYAAGLALQESLVAARRRGLGEDTLFLLEHPPVITLGRSSGKGHVLAGAEELRRRGIECHEVGRGGDVTYHGPGQIVGYPVLALRGARRDAHLYLRDLESAMIRSAAAFGVSARREPGLTGIWVGRDKLAAIGVRLNTGWITSHGFAFNVSTDLRGFGDIVPCGIRDRGVTSLRILLGRDIELRRVAAVLGREVSSALGFEPRPALAPTERLADPGTRNLSCRLGRSAVAGGSGRGR